jgi:cytochrome c5
MKLFYRVKLQIISCLRLKSLTKLQTLGLIAGMVVSLSSSAAVQEAQSVKQEDVDTAITPVSSSQSKKDDKKSLANEPEPLGKMLYENHCLSCHESMVHIRETQKAKTIEDIQYWVGRWSIELDVKWSADEIDAVVQHLNETFYHY